MPAAKPIKFTLEGRKGRVLAAVVAHDAFSSEEPLAEPQIYAALGGWGPRICGELKWLTDEGLLKRSGLRRHYRYRSTVRGKKTIERLSSKTASA